MKTATSLASRGKITVYLIRVLLLSLMSFISPGDHTRQATASTSVCMGIFESQDGIISNGYQQPNVNPTAKAVYIS
jgi:hypothetical protein